MARKSSGDVEAQTKRLKEWLKPGDTVYTILRHKSPSGMSREIGLVILKAEPDFPGGVRDLHPNYAASVVLGLKQGKRDGIKISGCGMDMGFELVYRLSVELFGDGYALKHRWL